MVRCFSCLDEDPTVPAMIRLRFLLSYEGKGGMSAFDFSPRGFWDAETEWSAPWLEKKRSAEYISTTRDFDPYQ
jgi:hypothetical protein